ncbi:MAG TPA: acetate uptake transporter, partial [Acidimicrobiales bacterium]|nr:acetate uptake transporter [Acidimicrobiales bacterium]
FGATAFSTYGGFWIGLGLYILLGAGHATKATMVSNDLGWILLAFFIFNTYMLLWSLFVNKAVLSVFFTLEITELLLFIGNFASTANLVKAGGIVGVVTAATAWYTSAAGVVNGMAGRHILFVGKPMSFPAAR